MSGKRHLYSSVKQSHSVPKPLPLGLSTAAVPRSDPPTVIPFPNIQSEVASDLELSPEQHHQDYKVAPITNEPADDNKQNGKENDDEAFQCSLVAAQPSTEAVQKKKVKKAGIVIPSRYKTAALNYKTTKPVQPSAESVRRSQTTNKPKKATRDIANVTNKEKLSTTVVRGPPSHKQHLSVVNTPFRPGVSMVTSTPAVISGNSRQLHPADQSLAATSIVQSKNPTNMTKKEKKMSRTKYLEHRLLQAAYLDVMSYKAFEEQENKAKKQLYSLWNAVEQCKKEIAELDKAIAAEEMMTAVDKSLDIQISGLTPLTAKTANICDIHTKLAAAMDSTRHNVSLRNLESFNEDELRALLRETEDILANTMPHVREDVPAVTTLTDIHEDLLAVAEKEFVEIDRACSKLFAVTKLQLKETSLFLEEIQRANN